MEESEPEEILSEVGHIVHEVTGGEGGIEDQPVPVRDVYAFRQRIVKPGESIEPPTGEQAASPGPPPALPPAEEPPDRD
jgi:hypothetical protein